MRDETEISAIDEGVVRLRDLSGVASAVLAACLFLWQTTREGGWFDAIFGELSPPFLAGVLLWLLVSVFAIKNRQHRWVILSAPFALYPIFMAALLLGACIQGKCI